MAAASTVTFGTATVNGPPGPTDAGALPLTVTDLAANYTRWTYQTTSTKKWIWTLQLADLTNAQKLALETYFTDTAKGPLNTFTYVHSDGTSYSSCRFADTELQFKRVNGKVWDVTVRLEVQAQVQ